MDKNVSYIKDLNNNVPGQNFCSAPWIEGVLRTNGTLQTCCRNLTSLANWQEEGLQVAWQSVAFQAFRQKISEGRFPDEQCKKCYYNGTATSMTAELSGPFYRNRIILYNFTQMHLPVVDAIEQLFDLKQNTQETEESLYAYLQVLLQFKKNYARLVDCPEDVKQAIQKLITIGLIVKAFLRHDLIPPSIAPYRQVELQAKCNARCIHCMNLYSREIIEGPELDASYIDKAFSYEDDVIDFFMNGSEFLFYRHWKSIVERLVSHNVQIGISTNGIALTEENSGFLIEKKCIHSLNISMDGASKETVERIHVNVNYERLLKNIEYLLATGNAKQVTFNLVFSFVIMKSNYAEFPQLIHLVHTIMKGRSLPNVFVSGHPLVRFSNPGYQEFLEKEHMGQIPKEKLVAMFHEAQRASGETGIQTALFGYPTIDQFVEAGCPLPTLENEFVLLEQ